MTKPKNSNTWVEYYHKIVKLYSPTRDDQNITHFGVKGTDIHTFGQIKEQAQEETTRWGFWNGDVPVRYKAVEYKVGEPASSTWWSAMCVGNIRQGILVTGEDNYTFLIDNQHGDGFHKVANTGGSPRAGHKSVDNYEITNPYLEDSAWKTVIDFEAMAAEQESHDRFIQENDPEGWERLKSLREFGKNKGWL